MASDRIFRLGCTDCARPALTFDGEDGMPRCRDHARGFTASERTEPTIDERWHEAIVPSLRPMAAVDFPIP